MANRLPLVLLALAACSLPPLRGRAEIGKDAYAVFVADGPTGADLYAVLPTGGAPIQLTFSPVDESGPVLAPDGGTVAFLRREGADTSTRRSVWLLNLLSGAEREIVLPKSMAPEVTRVGWSSDGRRIYLAGSRDTLVLDAPPADGTVRPVPTSERLAADSAFFVLLGTPAFARVVGCGSALCIIGRDGESSPLVEGGTGPARWGPDSVGFFRGGQFEVRPLGAGHARPLRWTPAPARPRELTYFPGRP